MYTHTAPIYITHTHTVPASTHTVPTHTHIRHTHSGYIAKMISVNYVYVPVEREDNACFHEVGNNVSYALVSLWIGEL
jgi:hypothetical protein